VVSSRAVTGECTRRYIQGGPETNEKHIRHHSQHTTVTDTKRFCRQCDECAKYHRGKLKKQGPLPPVVPGAPYERWYIDLTGPHPKSEKGNIYILTCMDSFTKWTSFSNSQQRSRDHRQSLGRAGIHQIRYTIIDLIRSRQRGGWTNYARRLPLVRYREVTNYSV